MKRLVDNRGITKMAGALPEYDVFDDTEDEGVAGRWTRWIEGFEGMMDAIDIT